MSRFNLLLIATTLAVFAGFAVYQWGLPALTSWSGHRQRMSPAQAKEQYVRKRRKEQSPPARKIISFELPDLAGQQRNSSEWSGKLLLLNFWASWCGPCRKEIPMLKSLQKQYGAQGLQVVGLGEDKPSNVRDYAQHMNFNYPVLLGEQAISGMGRGYGNIPEVLPFSVLIGRDGRVLQRHRGELSRALIRKWIENRLQKPDSD